MNRERAKELLPIIQAFVDGKKIEYSNDGEEWSETETPTWDTDLVYRIKPEPKFDPNTLQPFDRVICRCDNFSLWQCNLFSNIYPRYEVPDYPVQCMSATFEVVVPYNEETKHLVGTTDEAPEYYRYWED